MATELWDDDEETESDDVRAYVSRHVAAMDDARRYELLVSCITDLINHDGDTLADLGEYLCNMYGGPGPTDEEIEKLDAARQALLVGAVDARLTKIVSAAEAWRAEVVHGIYAHGVHISRPAAAFDDLLQLLRAAWLTMTPDQREAALKRPEVVDDLAHVPEYDGLRGQQRSGS